MWSVARELNVFVVYNVESRGVEEMVAQLVSFFNMGL